LDLGTSCGWATLFDNTRHSGVQVFDLKRGESPGMRYLRFHRWLVDFPMRPELCVYEQAIRRGGAATAVALGFEAHLLSFCAQYGIEHQPVNLKTLKVFATGSGGASKGDMVAALSRKFGTPLNMDDNEADASWLREWALANIVADAVASA
jgi:Holliday junction resolvasome RuvABC endonuclease subunit